MCPKLRQSDPEGFTLKQQGAFFNVKEDKYSISGKVFKGVVSSPSMGLCHCHVGQGSFWCYLVLMGTVGVQGGMAFTILIAERCDFYCVNECIIYFGQKFGSISPCWDQPVPAGLLSTFSRPTPCEKKLVNNI